MNMNMIDLFKKAFRGSYYTIVGCGGNLQEWKDGYADILRREEVGTIKEWIQFTGKDLNDTFGLTGSNAYPSDLNILAFDLTDITNVGKLAMLKLQLQDRWFDDMVTNDLCREGKTPEDFGLAA